MNTAQMSKITELLMLEKADDPFQVTRDLKVAVGRPGSSIKDIIDTLVWHNVRESPRVANDVASILMG
jgi:hypothetical protein